MTNPALYQTIPCSNCGAPLVRYKSVKHATCFDCKMSHMREANKIYNAKRRHPEAATRSESPIHANR